MRRTNSAASSASTPGRTTFSARACSKIGRRKSVAISNSAVRARARDGRRLTGDLRSEQQTQMFALAHRSHGKEDAFDNCVLESVLALDPPRERVQEVSGLS